MKKIIFLSTVFLAFAQLQAGYDDFKFYNGTPHKIKIEVYYQKAAWCKDRTGDIGLTLDQRSWTSIGANGCNIRSMWVWAVDDQGVVKKNNKGQPLSLERQETFSPTQGWSFMIREINEVNESGDPTPYKRLKIEKTQAY